MQLDIGRSNRPGNKNSAQIAALTPKLLILDEITNNLDLETKEHIIQVLQDYPGAMIIIYHDRHV